MNTEIKLLNTETKLINVHWDTESNIDDDMTTNIRHQPSSYENVVFSEEGSEAFPSHKVAVKRQIKYSSCKRDLEESWDEVITVAKISPIASYGTMMVGSPENERSDLVGPGIDTNTNTTIRNPTTRHD
jgi:hypothetical protein